MANEKEGWIGGEEFNWDEVPDDAPPQAEDGLYTFKVTEGKAEKTSNGHPSVKLTVELTGKFGGGELGYVSRKIRDTVALTKDAAFRVKQLSKATGVKPPKTSTAEDMKSFADDLVGSEGIVRVRGNEGRDGKRYANVGKYCTPAEAEDIAKGGDGSGGQAGGAKPQARRPARRGATDGPAA